MRTFPTVKNKVPSSLIATVIALIFAAGICTQQLGIFTIFGGFLLGLMFHKHHAFVEAWRHQVGQFVLVYFLPIFFTYTGLRTNILGLILSSDWTWCGVIFATAVLGKVIPIYFAARASGHCALTDSAMHRRADEHARADGADRAQRRAFDLGVITRNDVAMLVLMAVCTTIMTGPLLQLLLMRSGSRVTTLVEA